MPVGPLSQVNAWAHVNTRLHQITLHVDSWQLESLYSEWQKVLMSPQLVHDSCVTIKCQASLAASCDRSAPSVITYFMSVAGQWWTVNFICGLPAVPRIIWRLISAGCFFFPSLPDPLNSLITLLSLHPCVPQGRVHRVHLLNGARKPPRMKCFVRKWPHCSVIDSTGIVFYSSSLVF